MTDVDEKKVIQLPPANDYSGDSSDGPIIVIDHSMDNTDGQGVSKRRKCTRCLQTNKLTLMTLTGVMMGIVIGAILKLTLTEDLTKREVMYISFIGDVFLRMLKALIIPLIVSTLVTAIANIDLSLSGKIAARTISFYLTTTVAAVIFGIILVGTIKPGKGHIDSGESEQDAIQRNVTTVDTLLDLVKNLFPPNIIQACIQQARTNLIAPKSDPNESNLYLWDLKEEWVSGTNILGLVVISAAIGVGLAQLGREAKTLTNFFNSLTALAMKITSWIIWLSPVGIMFLVAAKIVEMKDFGTVMQQLGLYFATVIVGLFIQGMIFLPTLYVIMTRKSPFRILGGVTQALATAFGTSSSSATLPVTIKCLEDNCNIDPRVVRFALPVGAAINMDGTALYEAVAAIFIAQVRNIELGIGNYIAISVTATAAAIGAAGIPQAGLVTMVMVLDTIGLPAEDVTLILAVDWLLDRFRTVINVLGDCYGAAIVAHRSEKELELVPSTYVTPTVSTTVIANTPAYHLST